ncbi:CBS domain-containing protein [Sphingorhabdus sp. Alg239-R122]|uniref:CBS domain-containing protein n=1 Tax=Sphingorhabdus sp. Alg239-R122 TaxID=2305989 RepID=UPI0013DABDA6|nr:CBS domain-containing protein [Sphingorhabdus sp. Alg239-R122]
MTVAKILENRSGELFTCHGDDSVMDAIAMLSEKRIGALPVMAGGKVAGIFSERDVIYCLQSDGAGVLDTPVSNVMTAPAITIASDATALSALSLMSKRRIRHLPVVEGEKLVGFVSIGDLVKYRIDKIESEAAAMRDYIQSA